MCKIATFTNGKHISLQQIEEIGNILLKSENDGFGYAALGELGVFVEKTVSHTFKSRFLRSNLGPVQSIVEPVPTSTQGDYAPIVGPVILHGRTSTNHLGINNCHPIVKQNYYLIHNGVVTDHGPKYKTKTTTDSEHVLTRFIEGIDSVEKQLTGYYAFSCIDPDGILHITRDSIADLYIAWIDSHDTFLIGTTENLIDQICYTIGANTPVISKIKDNTYLVFQGNDLTFTKKIKSRGFERQHAALSEKSLGRKLDLDGWESNVIDATIDETRVLNDREFDVLIESLDESYDIYSIRSNEKVDLETFLRLQAWEQHEYWFYDADNVTYYHESQDLEFFENAAI
jgi:predicted glutamine amidotransferase